MHKNFHNILTEKLISFPWNSENTVKTSKTKLKLKSRENEFKIHDFFCNKFSIKI